MARIQKKYYRFATYIAGMGVPDGKRLRFVNCFADCAYLM